MRLIGVLPALLALSGCAHADEFPYRWYGLDPVAQKLRASDEKQDLPLSACNPDEHERGKCVALQTLEFERLREDLIRLKSELKAAQKAGQP